MARPPGPYGPIQVIPPGLLGAIGLKGLGEAPGLISEIYQPILELRDWLFQANAVQWPVSSVALATGSGTSLFTGGGGPITVPNTQAWYVHSYTITSSPGAGDSVSTLAPGYFVPDGVTTAFNAIINPLHLPAHTGRVISAGSGFFVPPGATFGFAYTIVAAVTLSFFGYVRYTPLPT